jgi:hypothetical protein
VVLGVKLGGFAGVMRRVVMVPVRNVRVMSGEMMIPRFVVTRSLAVMMRGTVVVFRCLLMVLCCLLGHKSSSKASKFELGGGL